MPRAWASTQEADHPRCQTSVSSIQDCMVNGGASQMTTDESRSHIRFFHFLDAGVLVRKIASFSASSQKGWKSISLVIHQKRELKEKATGG